MRFVYVKSLIQGNKVHVCIVIRILRLPANHRVKKRVNEITKTKYTMKIPVKKKYLESQRLALHQNDFLEKESENYGLKD